MLSARKASTRNNETKPRKWNLMGIPSCAGIAYP
jgi:hypothetical protein